MSHEYYYETGELGRDSDSADGLLVAPHRWSAISNGDPIILVPIPLGPYTAIKSGDHMIVRGKGGECLDPTHESEKSVDPIAGPVRKVRMRCS